MLSNHWKTIFCIIVAAGAIQAQYIPFPTATKLDREPPYLNPSVLDPLFFDGNDFRGYGRNFGPNADVDRLNAIKFLGNSVYYDSIRKIYINIVTGDYYDPTTGLIYRRVTADRTGFVNGRVGPNPVSSNFAPAEKSDEVDLPKELRAKIYQKRDDSVDDDEDCNDCERKGQCYRCKRIKPKFDCNACWSGKAFSGCDKCNREKIVANLPFKRMGELIVIGMNRLRKSYDVKDVQLNKHLTEAAMVQDLYMANRGYLNNDNFLAHISTFRGGNMTTGFIQEARLSDQDGADRFLALWKKSPEHLANLIAPNVDQCGAAVYFDQKGNRFIATVICVKL